MNSIIFPFRTVAAAITLCCSAFAAGEGAQWPAFPESSHISGDKITPESLKGKYVLFEYWGVNCPPCVASLPKLQKLHRTYDPKVFAVIGSHVQNAATPDIQKLLSKSKVQYPVYQMQSLPGNPCPGGIPYAVFVDPDGKVIAKGNPHVIIADVEKTMRKLPKGGRK